ncbi:hypothetical protein P8452_67597 [Trifolium repens]|nr:hypothetical protein P8452_67597 [Trifolium repens]
MMMKSSIIFLSILIHLTLSHSSTQNQNLSVYETLQQYDFPVGILPQGATSYELNKNTGKFTVYFDGTCIFGIKSYDLKYKSTIKGFISKEIPQCGCGFDCNGLSNHGAPLSWCNMASISSSSSISNY